MPFKASYFNLTLFFKNVKRFWPIWGLYTLIWIFVLPVNLWNTAHYYYNGMYGSFAERTLELVLGTLSPLGVLGAAGFGLLAAMAVFSYLYSARAATLIHTLPIRREGLFLTNYVSGLSFLVVPNVVIAVITLLVGAVSGYFSAGAVLLWLGMQCLVCLFFYSFAVFCAMFTGHILALPIFYGIFNILTIAILGLVQMLMQQFLYGFNGLDWFETVAEWGTPGYKLIESLYPRYVATGASYLYAPGVALIYGAVGLVLTAVALFVYRRRHAERAGDVVTVRKMRPVFRYGVAFCAAISIGFWMYAVFFERYESAWTLVGFMLAWGAIGYFIAEMFLQKSFRVFKKWRGCAVFLGVFFLLCGAVMFDFTGFETRVPSLDSIESVSVSGPYGTYPDDAASYLQLDNLTNNPEVFAAVTDAHRAIVAAPNHSIRGYSYTDNYSAFRTTSFNVTYRLKNGQVITRSYSQIRIYQDETSQPAYVEKLEALLNQPAVMAAAYAPPGKPTNLPLLAELALYGPANSDPTHLSLSRADAERLYAAVQADLAEGNFRRYLSVDDAQDNCYRNFISFQFRMEGERTVNGVPRPAYQTEDDLLRSVTVNLQKSATHTLRAYTEIVQQETGAPPALLTLRDWWARPDIYDKYYW